MGKNTKFPTKQGFQTKQVRGPNGRALTMADLPAPGTKRWVSRRKAEVVAAVRGGLISLDDACRRYELSEEEFLTWEHAMERFGVPGLRATHANESRQINLH